NMTCACPLTRSVRASAVPRYGSAGCHAGHQLEQLAGYLLRGADAQRDPLGTEIAASAGLVLGDDRLTESTGQPATNRSRDNVGRCSGDSANDESHRPGRVGLRICDAYSGW